MIKWTDLVDIVPQGIDDYPDMANAGVESAFLPGEDRYLTEEELDYIQATYPEEVQELARGVANG